MSSRTPGPARRTSAAVRWTAPVLLVCGVLTAKAGSMIAAGMSG